MILGLKIPHHWMIIEMIGDNPRNCLYLSKIFSRKSVKKLISRTMVAFSNWISDSPKGRVFIFIFPSILLYFIVVGRIPSIDQFDFPEAVRQLLCQPRTEFTHWQSQLPKR